MAAIARQFQKLQHGLTITLDKAMADSIGLQEDGEVEIVVENGKITMAPMALKVADSKAFQKNLDHLVEKHHGLLKRLAQ